MGINSKAAVIFVSSIFLFGCSGLHRAHYFSPTAKAGSTSDYHSHFKAVNISGPPVSVVLHQDGAKILIRAQPAAQKLVSFGPIWVPVVPTIFNWFFRIPEQNQLVVDVIFQGPLTAWTWSPHQSTLTNYQDETVIAPVHVSTMRSDRAIVNLAEIDISKIDAMTLRFPVSADDAEWAFQMGGLSASGAPVTIPPVIFRRAKAWAISVVP